MGLYKSKIAADDDTKQRQQGNDPPGSFSFAVFCLETLLAKHSIKSLADYHLVRLTVAAGKNRETDSRSRLFYRFLADVDEDTSLQPLPNEALKLYLHLLRKTKELLEQSPPGPHSLEGIDPEVC